MRGEDCSSSSVLYRGRFDLEACGRRVFYFEQQLSCVPGLLHHLKVGESRASGIRLSLACALAVFRLPIPYTRCRQQSHTHTHTHTFQDVKLSPFRESHTRIFVFRLSHCRACSGLRRKGGGVISQIFFTMMAYPAAHPLEGHQTKAVVHQPLCSQFLHDGTTTAL